MVEADAVYAIWLREFKVFVREKERIIASVISPLLWLFVFSTGLGSTVVGDSAGFRCAWGADVLAGRAEVDGTGATMAELLRHLDASFPGAVAEEVNQFYGYYTVHIVKGGVLFGMLSVNGVNGVVWYHSWHGVFIQSREIS